jgi:uncharacterized membrane protein
VEVKMEFTSGFLVVGLLMTLAGAILIYQSLKASPSEATTNAKGVVFLGPLPIMVAGSRRWIVAALGAAGIVLLWLISSSINSGFMGWI